MLKVLSQEQVDRFNKDGFVSPIRAISRERAAELRQRLEYFERKTGAPLSKTLCLQSHLIFTWINELIREERILDAIQDLYGENIFCWQSLFFIKEPDDPAFLSWHQDSTYWGLSSPDVVTAWIALSESNKENGAMEVIPGTHLEDQLPHRDTFAKDNMLPRGQEVAVEVDKSKAVALELEPGEMSLHHVRLVHGSAPNRSKTQRRIGFAIRYIPTYVYQLGGKDSASLVRGVDTTGKFEHQPNPAHDLDPASIIYHTNYLAQSKNLVLEAVARQQR